jgi:glycosyltransferase involved in cell wall biosynthesis
MSDPNEGRGVVEVDVIIPVRNVDEFLEEAIRSALDQGGTITRVVVVDDASSDPIAVPADLSGRGRVMVLRSEQHIGIGAARNRGVEATSAPWLAFLDADDVWPAGRLEALVAAVGETDVFASGMVEHFADDSGDAAYRVPEGAEHAILAGSTLLARAAFVDIGGFEPALRVGEFVDLMARGFSSGWTGGRCETVVLRRRVHANHASRQEAAPDQGYLKVVRDQLRRSQGDRM